MSYKEKKHRPVGPMVVVGMNGAYRIIDKGDHSIIIPTRFKTRAAAERWIARKLESDS